MANNYKHSGKHQPILTASAEIASGALCYQEGIVGIATTKILNGGAGQLATDGVWKVPVPAGVARGDKLYADLFAGESVALTLTETGTTNTYIGIAVTTRDAAGNAEVWLNGLGVIGDGDTA